MQQGEDHPIGLTADEREDRKRKFLDNIRPLLQPTTLTGAGSVNALTDRISEYGVADVDAPTRLEILSKIRDGAGNGYYRAWSENMTALDITRDWMKSAAKGTNPAFVDTIMPLLHVSRLLFIKMSAKNKSKPTDWLPLWTVRRPATSDNQVSEDQSAGQARKAPGQVEYSW
jgi:protein phosphatase 1 regulatory subunit 10